MGKIQAKRYISEWLIGAGIETLPIIDVHASDHTIHKHFLEHSATTSPRIPTISFAFYGTYLSLSIYALHLTARWFTIKIF
jgi:hypothetical protein